MVAGPSSRLHTGGFEVPRRLIFTCRTESTDPLIHPPIASLGPNTAFAHGTCHPRWTAHWRLPRLPRQRGRGGSPAVRLMTYNMAMASKTERLSLRLTPKQDIVLRRAAEARGESTS